MQFYGWLACSCMSIIMSRNCTNKIHNQSIWFYFSGYRTTKDVGSRKDEHRQSWLENGCKHQCSAVATGSMLQRNSCWPNKSCLCHWKDNHHGDRFFRSRFKTIRSCSNCKLHRFAKQHCHAWKQLLTATSYSTCDWQWRCNHPGATIWSQIEILKGKVEHLWNK